jgi:hypothetical protein
MGARMRRGLLLLLVPVLFLAVAVSLPAPAAGQEVALVAPADGWLAGIEDPLTSGIGVPHPVFDTDPVNVVIRSSAGHATRAVLNAMASQLDWVMNNTFNPFVTLAVNAPDRRLPPLLSEADNQETCAPLRNHFRLWRNASDTWVYITASFEQPMTVIGFCVNHTIAPNGFNRGRDDLAIDLGAGLTATGRVFQRSDPQPYAADPNFEPFPGLSGTVAYDGHVAFFDLDVDSEPEPGPGPPVDARPQVSAGPNLTAPEGSAIALNGFAFDAEVGTPAVNWSYQPDSALDPGTTCAFADATAAQTTITCNDDGTFVVTLTASDGVNPPVSNSIILTAVNAAPSVQVTGPQPWQTIRAGTPITLNAAVSDAANDTLTCAISWDDGSSDTPAPQDGSCSGPHTFAQAGMFTIQVAGIDDDGGRGEAQVLVVVYDPDGGRAHLVGGLPANAGAVAGRHTTKDDDTFKARASYQPHDEGPAVAHGDIQFVVDSETLDASQIDWLVVTADRRIAIKGIASVHGGPSRGFVLYGWQGAPDRARLVLWSLDEGPNPGETLVFDNNPGADYDLDAVAPPPIAVSPGFVQVKLPPTPASGLDSLTMALSAL